MRFGTGVVYTTITQDPDHSAKRTLWGQQARDLIALAGLRSPFIVSRDTRTSVIDECSLGSST